MLNGDDVVIVSYKKEMLGFRVVVCVIDHGKNSQGCVFDHGNREQLGRESS